VSNGPFMGRQMACWAVNRQQRERNESLMGSSSAKWVFYGLHKTDIE